MAKVPHRTFEIFEFLQEASDALATKSARPQKFSLDPELWRFHQLDSVITESGVAHVTFKPQTDSKPMERLAKDLADLADLLPNGSRILLDFEGVQEFDSEAIVKLTDFYSKLQNKGSRVVLCNLESAVSASFFPHRKVNAK